MSSPDFEVLRCLGEGLVDYGNKAFEDYRNPKYSQELRIRSLGSNLGIWIEIGVIPFLEAHHRIPQGKVSDEELQEATRASGKKFKYGETEYRIERATKKAGTNRHLVDALHKLRQFRNDSMHGNPEEAEAARAQAVDILNWLVRDYVPLYSQGQTETEPARDPQPRPKLRPDPEAAPTPPPPQPPPQQPQYDPPPPEPPRPPAHEPNYHYEEPRSSVFHQLWRYLLKPALIIGLILVVIGIPAWFIYRAALGVGELWAGLPSFKQIVDSLPKPQWNDPPPATIAERMQPLQPAQRPAPPPPESAPPQAAPQLPPPLALNSCPPGSFFNNNLGQCQLSSLPPDDEPAPLPLLPDPIIEANNDCAPGSYRPEGSQRCISKRKYNYFRYEQSLTLTAGLFVQAAPVDESYTISVFSGSIRVYYAEDPASARNVVRNGRAQHLYNYAIVSCVLCPATFVTRQSQ